MDHERCIIMSKKYHAGYTKNYTNAATAQQSQPTCGGKDIPALVQQDLEARAKKVEDLFKEQVRL